MYDALNILQALDIISMDKKEICWIGLQDARVIREASRRVSGANLPARTLTQQERDGADESEEPEDDDMEIEQLQVFWLLSCCPSLIYAGECGGMSIMLWTHADDALPIFSLR